MLWEQPQVRRYSGLQHARMCSTAQHSAPAEEAFSPPGPHSPFLLSSPLMLRGMMAQQGHPGDRPGCAQRSLAAPSPHAPTFEALLLLAQLMSWSCALCGVDLEVALNHTPLGTSPSLAYKNIAFRNYVLFICFSPKKSYIPKGTPTQSLLFSSVVIRLSRNRNALFQSVLILFFSAIALIGGDRRP